MELTERRLEDLSDLRYQVFTCPFERPSKWGPVAGEAVIVSFAGTYGIGSDGNNDAHFMKVVVQAALEAWKGCALVLDLRGMEYEWGDAIGGVMRVGMDRSRYHRPLPTALVVSEANAGALAGILRMIAAEPSAWAFDTVEAAVQALEQQAQGQREAGPPK